MLDLLPALILSAAWGMHCGGTRVQGGPLVIPASGGVAWAETRVGGNGWIEHCGGGRASRLAAGSLEGN